VLIIDNLLNYENRIYRKCVVSYELIFVIAGIVPVPCMSIFKPYSPVEHQKQCTRNNKLILITEMRAHPKHKTGNDLKMSCYERSNDNQFFSCCKRFEFDFTFGRLMEFGRLKLMGVGLLTMDLGMGMLGESKREGVWEEFE
jgi:hypothetical protein